MLNYIVDMVTKTKRSLFILQQKDYNQRKFIERNDLEWRRRHADLISQTDGRIVELRRKTGMKKSDFHLNMIIISFHFSEETVLEIYNKLSHKQNKNRTIFFFVNVNNIND